MARYVMMVVVGAAAMALVAGTVLADAASSAPAAKAHKAGHAKAGHAKAGAGKAHAKIVLTPEQKAQAKAIMKAARAEATSAPDRATKHQILQAAREKVRTTVLTDAQRQQIAESKAGHKKGRHGKHAKDTVTPAATKA